VTPAPEHSIAPGVYAASKAAVRSFAPTWIVDLKDGQIRVNAISLGTIPTPGYGRIGLTHGKVSLPRVDRRARVDHLR
jgi:NAD(P)-dependent dehydrogenase (short-subunit alcohol dehydrogenase family)